MSNPFDNIQLKHWPDFLLALSGVSFTMAFWALIGGIVLPGGTLGWVFALAGVVSFGIAGKIAHYQRHDKAIYKWVSAWRNNWLSNMFLIVTMLLLVSSVYVFI